MNCLKKRIAASVLAAAMVLPSVVPMGADTGLNLFSSESVSAENVAFSQLQVKVKSDYVAEANSVTIKWKKVAGAEGYRIYRRDSSSETFTKVKTISGENISSYTDEGLKSSRRYIYKVKAYTHDGNLLVLSKASEEKAVCTTPAKSPTIDKVAETTGGSIKLKWNKVNCTGYMIYAYSYYRQKWVKVANIKDPNTVTCTLALSDYDWNTLMGIRFKIRAYKTDGDGNAKGAKATVTSETFYRMSVIRSQMASEIKRLEKAKITNKGTYTLMNTQPATSTKTTLGVSAADMATLKKFAKAHFKSSWTTAEKAAYTLNWINKNITYPTGAAFNKLYGVTYVDAIFNRKTGQCLQYNGAMISMLIYLGYDNLTLVQGYRGNSTTDKWQHFWTEIKIGSKSYVVETGCYENDGDWMYLCTPYSSAGGYIKNKKFATK